jgi:glycogen operon protein
VPDDYVYVAFNMHWEARGFGLPSIPDRQWHVVANTDMASPDDIWTLGEEPRLEDQGHVLLAPRSSVVLVGKNVA